MLFVIDRLIHLRLPKLANPYEENPTLVGDGVVLKTLTYHDANAFFNLYTATTVRRLSDNPIRIRPQDTAARFTQRIARVHEWTWTIRPAERPDHIVGECALHHWNKRTHEMKFDGLLQDNYGEQTLMATALQLVSAYAKTEYRLKAIIYTAHTSNQYAIHFAEQAGFYASLQSPDHIHFRKSL